MLHGGSTLGDCGEVNRPRAAPLDGLTSLASALFHACPEPALIGGHEGLQIGGIGVFRQSHAGAVDEITKQGDNSPQDDGD